MPLRPGRVALPALVPFTLASLLLGAVLAGGAWYRIDDASDVPLYLAYGARLLAGQKPYLDFAVEYPPLALPLFVLPALVAEPWLAARAFNAQLWTILAAAALATVGAAARRWPDGTRAWPVGLAFAAGALALGAISVNRFDGAVALVVALALLLLSSGRTSAAGAVLGVGFALKLTPAVLLPLALLLAADRRAALRAALAFAAAALLPLLPPLLTAPGGLARAFAYHLARPLQLEAVPATPLLLGQLLGGPAPSVASAFGSQNLGTPAADALARWSGLATLALLGLALALTWRRRAALRSVPEALPLAALTLLLALVTSAKVLSPQYLTWLLPALALTLPARPRLGGVVVVALLLTQLEFPSRYWALVALQPGPVALVVLRNGLLVLALGLALRSLWRLPAAQRDASWLGLGSDREAGRD